MTFVLSRMTAVVAMIMALAGCSYRGGDIGDPLTRKFHWFSFVDGEDIRATCGAGTPDRYRLVYNAIYDEQVRIYEVDGLRRLLTINVTDGGNMAKFNSSDLTAPWRARTEKVQLDQASYDRLATAFGQSGMFAPPPVGLDLPARSYFWTAAFCRDGRYGLTAWAHPSAAFDAINFDDILFPLDPTEVAVRHPAPLRFDPQWEQMRNRGEVVDFRLKIGRNGLVR